MVTERFAVYPTPPVCYESRTTYMSNEKRIWVTNHVYEMVTEVCGVSHSTCVLWVTNYLYESWTTYMSHELRIWVMQYVYESQTRFSKWSRWVTKYVHESWTTYMPWLRCMLFSDVFVLWLVHVHHESRTTSISHELCICHDVGVYAPLMYLWCDSFVRIMSESRTTYMSHELCICHDVGVHSSLMYVWCDLSLTSLPDGIWVTNYVYESQTTYLWCDSFVTSLTDGINTYTHKIWYIHTHTSIIWYNHNITQVYALVWCICHMKWHFCDISDCKMRFQNFWNSNSKVLSDAAVCVFDITHLYAVFWCICDISRFCASWVTNYVYESRTTYIPWRRCILVSDVFVMWLVCAHHEWVTNYVYESRTMYLWCDLSLTSLTDVCMY